MDFEDRSLQTAVLFLGPPRSPWPADRGAGTTGQIRLWRTISYSCLGPRLSKVLHTWEGEGCFFGDGLLKGASSGSPALPIHQTWGGCLLCTAHLKRKIDWGCGKCQELQRNLGSSRKVILLDYAKCHKGDFRGQKRDAHPRSEILEGFLKEVFCERGLERKVSLAAEARSRGIGWRDWGEFWQPGLGMHREAWDALKDHLIASPTPPQVILAGTK